MINMSDRYSLLIELHFPKGTNSLYSKGREYPKRISFHTTSEIIFWSCMPELGSIGRVQLVFSMYSYRLATFLSYD